jgi:hypothetical protein
VLHDNRLVTNEMSYVHRCNKILNVFSYGQTLFSGIMGVLEPSNSPGYTPLATTETQFPQLKQFVIICGTISG